MNDIRDRVSRGLGWRGAADVSDMVLQIVLTAILARLLDVADFGVAAMCLLFLRFVRSLTDVGFRSAVIQAQGITDNQISAIFLIQAVTKSIVCLICVAAAPIAAAFFEEPRLTELIRVLAWMVVLDGLAFPQALLQKRLEFRGYSALQVVSTLMGGALGVGLALSGFGVWSIIFRTLADRIIYATGVWLISDWRPMRPSFSGIGSLVTFGTTVFTSNVIHFWSQNFAAIILGKLLGADALGLFYVAHNLAVVPAQKVRSVLSVVLMPAFARVQGQLDRLCSYVYASSFSLGIVFVPLMLGMSVVAPNLIVVLYGEKWAGAGVLLSGLAFVGLLKGYENLLRSCLLAMGEVKTILKIRVLETFLAMPLLTLGTYLLGQNGTIIAYIVSAAVAFVLTTIAVQRRLDAAMLIAHTARWSLVCAVAMVLVVAMIPLVLNLRPSIILIVQVAIGIGVYVPMRVSLLTQEERAVLREWPVIGNIIARDTGRA